MSIEKIKLAAAWLLLAGIATLLRFKTVLQSDALFTDSLLTDWFIHGGRWGDWALVQAPAFVPDMLLYLLAYPLFPDAASRIFFVSAAQTKTESTVQAIQSTLDEIRRKMTTKISKYEFDMAKEMFLYSYVSNYAEPSRALGAVMELEFERLPADYLEKEFAGYQAVTAADIERVAKQYLKPEQATIFIVGDFPKIAQQAAALGEAREIQPFDFGESAARAR